MKKTTNKMNPIVAERLARYRTTDDHPMPVTRRDFLAAGILQGTAVMFTPSVVGILGSSLLSGESEAQAAGSLPPAYIEINCAGGAGFMANMAMLDAARNPLPSYNLLGQGSGSVAQQNMTRICANNAPVFSNSGIYKGLTAGLASTPDVLQQTVLLSLAAFIGADTGTNPMSAFGLVQSAIPSGVYLPNLQTFSTFNQPAYVTPPSPIVVGNIDAINDVVRPRASDTISQFGRSTKLSLLSYLQKLNDSQAPRYAGRPNGSKLKGAIDSALQKVTGIFGDSSLNFDPRNDAAFKTIWGSSWDPNGAGLIAPELTLAESAPDVVNRNLNESAVVYNLAKGYGNTGGLYRVGYDYHGNPRPITDAQDAEIGQLVARILLSFRATGRPVYIYITTDGTVFAPASDAGGNSWVGDSAANTVTMVFAYRPGTGVQMLMNAGRPETQIGQFTTGQIADLTHPVSSPRGTAAAAFINYLNFCGVDGVNSPYAKVTTMGPDVLAKLSAIRYA